MAAQLQVQQQQPPPQPQPDSQLAGMQQQVFDLQAQVQQLLAPQRGGQPGPGLPQEPGFMPHLRMLQERKAVELAQPAAPGPAIKPGKLEAFVGEGGKGPEDLSYTE
jgi:hypothetical protein